MKKAFTLAETLIVLVLVGVLAIIVLSSLTKLQPDREKMLFKKAYSITERTVGELVNDESIYLYDPNKIGFRNTDPADVEGTSTVYQGAEKFCRFFARKLNTFEDTTFDSSTNSCDFQTTDGITWNVQSYFDNSVENVVVSVDINGVKDPNIPTLTSDEVLADPSLLDITAHPELTASNRDRYFIYVHFDGRVTVAPDSQEAEFLKSHDSKENHDD